MIAPAVKAARATLLILALALGSAARAQQPVAPLPFDHILRYDELTTLLEQWARARPDLVELESIGTTRRAARSGSSR